MSSGLFSDDDYKKDEVKNDEIKLNNVITSDNKIKEENKSEDDRKTLFLLDGYNIIYRSYFAHSSSPLLTAKGENVSAYYGFFQTLIHLFNSNKIDSIAVIMDEEGKTFRQEMFPDYKGTRDRAPSDLHTQVPYVKNTLKKTGIPVLSKKGMEADDVIASIATISSKSEYDVVIVTSDKDLMQLVNDHIFVLRPPKGGEKEYVRMDKKKVEEFYGVRPEQITDYLSILGDTSDNVPGIKGLGEKAAIRLLNNYLTLDGIYRHLDALKESEKKKLLEGREDAILSKKLITLNYDAFPDDFSLELFKNEDIKLYNAKDDFIFFGQNRLQELLEKFLKNELPTKKSEIGEVPSRLFNDEKYLLKDGDGKELKSVEEVLNLIKATDSRDIVIFPLLDYGKNGIEALGIAISLRMFSSYCFFSSSPDELRKILFEVEKKNLEIIVFEVSTFYRFTKLLSLSLPISRNISLEAWEVDSNEKEYTLEYLFRLYFGLSLSSLDSVAMVKDAGLKDLSAENMRSFVLKRTDSIRKLSLVIKKRFTNIEEIKEYEEIEKPLSPILVDMEDRGIFLEKNILLKMSKEFDSKIDLLKKDIFLLSGKEFNINSPGQLGKILFEELSLPHGKKTQTGYSTDTETLESLLGISPIIEKILSYRAIVKLKNTYIDVLPTLQDKNGRIHTTFLQTGTATGRLSSKEPNLQNIPVRSEEGRKIRSSFYAQDGYVFLSADYSQIELVVLSNLSGDKMLQEAFLSGGDVHKATASLVFDKPLESVTKEERQSAKVINFGIIYGMSPFRLGKELGIKREESSLFINRYFEKYSGVKSYIEKCNTEAREKGYIRTYFGHRRNISGLDSPNKTVKAASERMVLNSIVQGTAAEIMKKSMINVDAALKKEGLKSELILTVHDELILECPISEVEKVKKIVKSEMENVVQFSVPLKVSIETASSWGDIH